MNQSTIVRDGYNAIAARYTESRNQDSEDVELLDILIRRLPPNARILDAGCGAGVPVTRRLNRAHHVVGVDFSEAQLALARQRVPDAEFLCQDLTTLQFPDSTFDAIVSYYAIIHIPREQHRALFRIFYRMLQAGGYAFLCLGANDIESDWDDNYLGTRMYWSHFDDATNLAMLEGCGFETVWSKVVSDASAPQAAHLFVLSRKPRTDTGEE
jgi:ubiquinone/menaquinone biosynthesis C-methylase UbiE